MWLAVTRTWRPLSCEHVQTHSVRTHTRWSVTHLMMKDLIDGAGVQRSVGPFWKVSLRSSCTLPLTLPTSPRWRQNARQIWVCAKQSECAAVQLMQTMTGVKNKSFFWRARTWSPTWASHMTKILLSRLTRRACMPLRSRLHFQLIIIRVWHHRHSCIPLLRFPSVSFACSHKR